MPRFLLVSGTMTLEEIRIRYDDLRRTSCDAGMRRDDLGTVVRLVGVQEPVACVVHAQLDENTADAAIREQIEYFQSRGHDFEWKWHAHDTPADLQQRLLAHGFEPDEPEAILVLPLDTLPDALTRPVSVDIRKVAHVDQLEDVRLIERTVWGQREHSHVDMLARELTDTPDQITIYVAYVDNAPAASGFIRYVRGSAFAGLWGGSTHPAHRKKGIYSALVAVRAREAFARGVAFLTVDARPASRPILEKIGFQLLAHSTPMLWRATR